MLGASFGIYNNSEFVSSRTVKRSPALGRVVSAHDENGTRRQISRKICNRARRLSRGQGYEAPVRNVKGAIEKE